MNNIKYDKILQVNLRVFVNKHNIGFDFYFQKDTDLRHKGKIENKFFNYNKIKLFE